MKFIFFFFTALIFLVIYKLDKKDPVLFKTYHKGSYLYISNWHSKNILPYKIIAIRSDNQYVLAIPLRSFTQYFAIECKALVINLENKNLLYDKKTDSLSLNVIKLLVSKGTFQLNNKTITLHAIE